MPALLKAAAIIVVLLLLLKLKIDLGLALLADSALTAILFHMTVSAFLRNAGQALVAKETLDLLGILILVLYLGNFLQTGGHFGRMVGALKSVVRDRRLILAIPSAFIGLLPMMAGAMMGAPIVEEAAKPWALSPAWKTFLNYWFRHIWEYSWPLYMNLILAALIIDVPIGKVCLYQFPFTILAAGVGVGFLFGKVPYRPAESEPAKKKGRSFVRIFTSVWPIFLTIILIFVFRVAMLWALAASSLLSQILSPMPVRVRLDIFRKSVTPRIILLTAAVMVFKRILEASGALDEIVRAVPPGGFATYILLFAAPFAVGLLTGVNQAFVAIAFPLLAPIIGKGNPDMVLFLFAYVSGFVGILLSPAHLCLAFTADYFQAELKDVYKILIAPVGIVFGAAVLVLIVFRIL